MTMIVQLLYKSYILTITLTAILLGLSSCTESIELDTDDADPVIVIYSTLTDELTYQQVQLSSSTGYFDGNKNAKVSGATITITSDKGDLYNLEEVHNTPGTYKTTTQMAGIPGENYHLKVMVDFNNDGINETYEADAKMELPVKLDSIDISYEKIAKYHYYSFNIYAKEPAGTNYYMCKYIVNDSVYDRISKYVIFDDLSYDNQYINGSSIGYFFDDTERDEYKDADDYNTMTFIADGDVVKLQLSNIGKGFYNFLLQCQEEKDGESPFFGGPLSNISTNIKGGGIGYFAAYSISQKQAIAKKEQ